MPVLQRGLWHCNTGHYIGPHGDDSDIVLGHSAAPSLMWHVRLPCLTWRCLPLPLHLYIGSETTGARSDGFIGTKGRAKPSCQQLFLYLLVSDRCLTGVLLSTLMSDLVASRCSFKS